MEIFFSILNLMPLIAAMSGKPHIPVQRLKLLTLKAQFNGKYFPFLNVYIMLGCHILRLPKKETYVRTSIIIIIIEVIIIIIALEGN